MAKLALECQKTTDLSLLLLRQIGGSQESGTRHKKKKGKDSKGGDNWTSKDSLSESSIILQTSSTFAVFFRLQT